MTTTAETTPASLYDRIGGRDALERIVPTVLALHLENPVIAPRFRNAKKSIPELTRLAVEFFHTGLSGEPIYTGMSMPDAHRGMNIGDAEYLAVLDDIMAALQQHGVAPAEQAELLYIAYGMRRDIVAQ